MRWRRGLLIGSGSFALVLALWFCEHSDFPCEASPAAQDIRLRLQ
jgi:hypothetical protein